MRGVVKFYNRNKDFGFVRAEDNEEYYFNAASVRMPGENDEVEFITQTTPKGIVAKKMVIASKPATKRSVLKAVVMVVLVVAAFCVGYLIR